MAKDDKNEKPCECKECERKKADDKKLRESKEYSIYRDSKHVPGVDEDTEPEDKSVCFDDGK